MRSTRTKFCAILATVSLTCAIQNSSGGGFATTVQPLATQAALEAFAKGGNAIDAAAAAALTLGVVDGHNSGIGGGCFMLIRLASGEIVALDGRETAPAAAHPRLFYSGDELHPEWSKNGALASGVPGALAVYAYALEHYGKRTLAEALQPGIRYAEQGFPIDTNYARKLKQAAAVLHEFPASQTIFLKADGAPYEKGEVITQKDLAASYRAIATQGPSWFYEQLFPQLTEEWMKANGGILTAADFQSYRLKTREPLVTTYRGYTIVGFPPPSSGGLHIAQILNILETFDLKNYQPNSPEWIHLVSEAMKIAFADRAFWLGDPAFTPVPRGLADKGYAATLAAQIDLSKATAIAGPGQPPNSATDVFSKHTTHFATADSEGNWVVCTATINTAFGSKVVIPGTGILLNNQMDDFAIAPGVPNHFKLVGGEANRVEAGKRPLSSMSPTLVLKDNVPVMSAGAAGGPTIISQTLLALLYTLDYGMRPAEALSCPRFHHQWSPDEIRVENTLPAAVADHLREKGHTLKVVEPFGSCQVITLGKEGFSGASDPRVEGWAAGSP